MGALHKAIFESCAGLTYRRATTTHDFDEIGRLRAAEYNRTAVYQQHFDEPLVDDLDRDPSTFVFGIHQDGTLVSTVRLCIVDADNRSAIVARLFSDVLDPLLDQGMTFIDPSRFVISPDVSRSIPGLPLITLRLAVMAMIEFEGDYCLSTVRKGHIAFYRRVFKSTVLAPLRRINGVTHDIALLGSARSHYDAICENYPVFHFSKSEARMLFREPPRDDLSVRPYPNVAARVA